MTCPPVHREEGGQVGRVGRDQDEGEEPPDPTWGTSASWTCSFHISSSDHGFVLDLFPAPEPSPFSPLLFPLFLPFLAVPCGNSHCMWQQTCNPVYGSQQTCSKFINFGLKSYFYILIPTLSFKIKFLAVSFIPALNLASSFIPSLALALALALATSYIMFLVTHQGRVSKCQSHQHRDAVKKSRIGRQCICRPMRIVAPIPQ